MCVCVCTTKRKEREVVCVYVTAVYTVASSLESVDRVPGVTCGSEAHTCACTWCFLHLFGQPGLPGPPTPQVLATPDVFTCVPTLPCLYPVLNGSNLANPTGPVAHVPNHDPRRHQHQHLHQHQQRRRRRLHWGRWGRGRAAGAGAAAAACGAGGGRWSGPGGSAAPSEHRGAGGWCVTQTEYRLHWRFLQHHLNTTLYLRLRKMYVYVT